jgi:hypothetical protein
VVQSFSTSTAFSLVAVVVVASVWHWWRCAFSSASAFFASVWWSPRSRPSLFRCGGVGLGGLGVGLHGGLGVVAFHHHGLHGLGVPPPVFETGGHGICGYFL